MASLTLVWFRISRSWRWLFNVNCSEPFCNARRRCWLWHLETLTCPTCKREVTEMQNGFGRVLNAVSPMPSPTVHISVPSTHANTTTATFSLAGGDFSPPYSPRDDVDDETDAA